MQLIRTHFLLIALAASVAWADQRPFVWTYGSDMMDRGQAELETYTTFSSPDWSQRDQNMKATHQFELEFGMNQHFDFAIYQVISQMAGGDAHWDGMKLRARYKLSDNPRWWHPIAYVETKLDETLSELEYELKLLLEKNISRFTFAVNPILEIKEEEQEFEFAAGLSYELGKLWAIGAEVKSSEYGTWVGPTISHGGKSMYMALGGGWSLDDPKEGKPSHQFRLIIGVQLKDRKNP